jgi:hypothetical protein
MAEKEFTLKDVENISKELNIPIEEIADTYGFDLKKKESTEPVSSPQQETALESTTQPTEEEQPPKKKRGSVVSKKPSRGQPLESSVGKEDKNVYYYNVNPKVGAVESEPEVPKGYTTVKKVENSKEVELWKKQKAKFNQDSEEKPKGSFVQQLKEQKKQQDLTGKRELIEAKTVVKDQPELKAMTEAKKTMADVYNEKTQKVEIKPLNLPKVDFNSGFLSFDSLNEIDKQLSSVGVGIKTIKYGEGDVEFKANQNTLKDFRNQEKSWYQSAKVKVGDISLTKEDALKIEEEYNSELNRTGLLDETEDLFRSVTNIAAFKFTGESQLNVRGDNFADIRTDLMKEDPKFKDLKPEQKEQKIKERYFEIKQDAILLNKYYDAAEKLTPQERFAITKQSRNLLAATQKQNKAEFDKVAALNVSIENLVEKRNTLTEQAKKSKSKEEFSKIEKEYNQNESAISGYYSELVKSRNNYYKSAEKINDLKVAVNGYSAETNEFIDIAKRVKAWGYGAIANMMQFGKDFYKDIGVPVLGEKEFQEEGQKGIDVFAKKQEETIQGLRKVDEVDSISSALNKTTEIFGDSLGMVMALTYGGPAGMAWMSLDTAGAQLRNINDQNRAFKSALSDAEDKGEKKVTFDGKEYDVEKNKNKNLYGDTQKWVSAVGYGLAMQLPLLQQLKTIGNPILRNTAPELLSKSFGEKLVQQSTRFGQETAKLDVILRGTNVINGLNDKYVLGKDFDLLKSWGGLDQSLHAVLLHSMNVGAAHIKGGESSLYLNNKETSKIYENSVRAKEIGVKLEDPNLTPEAKKILIKEGELLEAESKELIDKGIDRLAEMPVEDRNLVLELTNKSNKIKTEAQEVKDSNLSKEDKEVQLQRLKNEYKRVFDKIDEINTSSRKRNDGFYGLNDKEQKKRIEDAKKNLESKSDEPISDRDAKYKAILDYNTEALKSEVYYYSTKNGDVKPEEVPDGYTSVKEVSNSEELNRYIYQKMSETKSVSELEAIEFDKRSDAEHAEFIQKKTAEVLHQRGFLNNEIKLALSVMNARANASGLGNAWYRQIENIDKGDFVQNKNIKYQVFGKKGAEALDLFEKTNFRMINLSEAEKMEKSGYSPKDILKKTGWQKGADGEWKFEVTDNIPFLKDTVRLVKDILYKEKDTEVISQKANYFLPEELLASYPALKDITIEFNKFGDETEAYYDSKNKTISVNIGVYIENTVSTLLHEVQHVIQKIEGFAKGGNVEMMRTPNDVIENLSSNLPELTKEQRLEIKNEYEKNGLSRLPILPTRLDVTSDSIGTIENLIDKLDILIKLFPNESSYKNLQDALELKLMEMGGKDIAFEKYQKIAGEVEASNVQSRMNMTTEQRRNTLLEETEKFPRNEQKIQFQENRQPLGAAETLENGRMVLHFFENANLSTVIHEGLGHVMERELTPEQMIVIQEWAGTEGWTNETSEAFARGVERYFFDGVAPTNKLKDIFDGIKKYMKDIYVSIKGTELEADINPEAKAVLDKLFTAEEPVKTEAGKELSLQEKAKNINQKVLESRSYDIIAGLIRDGIIKQKPC